MQPDYRRAFNAQYTPAVYHEYLKIMEKQLNTTVPFRVAETPFFIPTKLRSRLQEYAQAIVQELCEPSFVSSLESIVPKHYDVP